MNGALKPGEAVIQLRMDIDAMLQELHAARLIGKAIETLAKEQPDRYGALVADLKAVLGRPAGADGG